MIFEYAGEIITTVSIDEVKCKTWTANHPFGTYSVVEKSPQNITQFNVYCGLSLIAIESQSNIAYDVANAHYKMKIFASIEG